jgi:hypothetical protein
MRLPRMTVCGLICLVIGCGLAFHVAFAAIRVSDATEYHAHAWVTVRAGKPYMTMAGSERPPFWPRYWRCLVGIPWKARPLCPRVEGRLLDTCEFAVPEIRKPIDGTRFRIQRTRGHAELIKRLTKSSP